MQCVIEALLVEARLYPDNNDGDDGAEDDLDEGFSPTQPDLLEAFTAVHSLLKTMVASLVATARPPGVSWGVTSHFWRVWSRILSRMYIPSYICYLNWGPEGEDSRTM